MKRRRGRLLSQEETALWRYVTRGVTPLPGHEAPPEPAPPAPAAAVEVKEPVRPSPSPARTVERRPPAPPPLAPLERRLMRDLRRGVKQVDARIDLHGMRQAEAHATLVAFLRRAQVQGARVVIVVTGKGDREPGAGDDPFRERGVLRRLTPHWLDQPDLRPVVAGYSRAGREHGGEGALYVRLRRPAAGGGR